MARHTKGWRQRRQTITRNPPNPLDSPEEVRLTGKLLRKMLRKNVTGAHKKQIDTVTNWFASDEQGAVKDLIDKLISKPEFPLEQYGARDAIRVTEYQEAKEWVDRLGFDTEWL